MFANRVRVGNKALLSWEEKKKYLRRKLRNSMKAAERRGNYVLARKKKAQLNKL